MILFFIAMSKSLLRDIDLTQDMQTFADYKNHQNKERKLSAYDTSSLTLSSFLQEFLYPSLEELGFVTQSEIENDKIVVYMDK